LSAPLQPTLGRCCSREAPATWRPPPRLTPHHLPPPLLPTPPRSKLQVLEALLEECWALPERAARQADVLCHVDETRGDLIAATRHCSKFVVSCQVGAAVLWAPPCPYAGQGFELSAHLFAMQSGGPHLGVSSCCSSTHRQGLVGEVLDFCEIAEEEDVTPREFTAWRAAAAASSER
jgi:hypothetical protein